MTARTPSRVTRIRPYLLFGSWSVFLLILLAYFLCSTWKATSTTANETSANEARILANSLDTAVRRVEGIMGWTELAVGQQIDDESISALLLSLTENFREITGVAYYSPEGTKRSSSTSLQCIINEDSKMQIFLSSHPQLEYSDTLVCNETGKHIMLVHRSIFDDSGALVGFIAASLDLSFYEGLFSQIQVGQGGMVSFRRTDTSQLVVRWPIISEQINNLAPGIPPQVAISQGQREGVIRYSGATDGIERIFAFRQLESYPFYALVGREVGDVFDSWTLNSVLSVIMTLLLLVTSGIFLVHSEKNLNLKNRLINELLHRTNNSLQLVLSLVQLSLFQTESTTENSKSLLESFYSRVRTLSLAQKCITRDFSSVVFRDLIVGLAKESTKSVQVTVDPPQSVLLLDFAVPLGLILNELFESSSKESIIGIVVSQTTNVLTMSFRASGSVALTADAESIVRTLCAHQLRGNFVILATNPFECTVDFPLDSYRNRVNL